MCVHDALGIRLLSYGIDAMGLHMMLSQRISFVAFLCVNATSPSAGNSVCLAGFYSPACDQTGHVV